MQKHWNELKVYLSQSALIANELMKDTTNERYAVQANTLEAILNRMENTEMQLMQNNELESLGLPLRTYNAIRRAGVHNLQELTILTEEEVYRIKGVSRDGVNHIKIALNEIGLSLSEE